MTIDVVFETHSWSVDNDRGLATGWLPGALSERGRALAKELGERRRDDGLARSSVRTCIVLARRLRSHSKAARFRCCWIGDFGNVTYGQLNGTTATDVHAQREAHLEKPFSGGESWAEALDRVEGFLRDLSRRWSGQRVLVVGHVATRWALDRFVNGETLAELSAAKFVWREGWEYRLPE